MRARLIVNMLWVGVLCALCWCGSAVAHAAVGMRYSTNADRVRIVLDLPQYADVTDTSTPEAPAFAVDFPLEEALPPTEINDPIVREALLQPDEDGKAMLSIVLDKPRRYRLFTLEDLDGKPYRVVVDVMKRFSEEETRQLSPAVSYTHIERQFDQLYSSMHIMTIDATDPHVRFSVVPAEAPGERVADMTARTGAACGVNGGFFLAATRPVGLLKSRGIVLSLPIWGRAAVGFPHTGPPKIDHVQGAWLVVAPDGTVHQVPDGLDASIAEPPAEIMVFAGNNFRRSPSTPDYITALIRGGKVIARVKAAMDMEPGDFAIQFRDTRHDALTAQIIENRELAILPMITPFWGECPDAVGAGPRLIRDGRMVITGKEERFKPDILEGRRARTALGVTKDGRVILLVVEGPGPYGGGATLAELAAILHARGAVDALNLDGGGSSCMVVNGGSVNCAPEAFIRPVASGILVFDDRIAPVPCEPAE